MASPTAPITKIPADELFPTLRRLNEAGVTTDHAAWLRKPGEAEWLIAAIEERKRSRSAGNGFPLTRESIANVRPGDTIEFRSTGPDRTVQRKVVRRAVNGMLHLDLAREPGRLTTHPVTGEAIIYCWGPDGFSQMRPSVLQPVGNWIPIGVELVVVPAESAAEPADAE